MASQAGGADDANEERKSPDIEAELLEYTDSMWDEFKRLFYEDGEYVRHTFYDVDRLLQFKSFSEQRRSRLEAALEDANRKKAEAWNHRFYNEVVPRMRQRGRWMDDGSDGDMPLGDWIRGRQKMDKELGKPEESVEELTREYWSLKIESVGDRFSSDEEDEVEAPAIGHTHEDIDRLFNPNNGRVDPYESDVEDLPDLSDREPVMCTICGEEEAHIHHTGAMICGYCVEELYNGHW